jgi:hypothetical protein
MALRFPDEAIGYPPLLSEHLLWRIVGTEFREHPSVLKNSLMPPWSPDQGLKDPLSAVFWAWFSGVVFVFDLPTGQIATFSTG